MCCSPWGCKELDTTWQLNHSNELVLVNTYGNAPQYSCLENSMDRSLAGYSPVQFSSVTQSCPTLYDSVDCSTPGVPVYHLLLELAQTHVHRVGDAIQSSHPLSPPSPAFNLSQHQGLFKSVRSSHQVAKVLEFELQHQSFQ